MAWAPSSGVPELVMSFVRASEEDVQMSAFAPITKGTQCGHCENLKRGRQIILNCVCCLLSCRNAGEL